MAKALMIEPHERSMTAKVEELPDERFPGGDTTVEVLYSSLNYKDGLAVTGKGQIIRGDFPFVPGIDLVGRVRETTSGRFEPGDLVIQNGWGLGERHWGGFSTLARTRADWLVRLPSELDPRDAAVLGTAGYTAMLAVMTLEEHSVDRSGEIVVTGASGGVGSVAVHVLAQLGYRVVASTGKTDAHEYLQTLGAAAIEDRDVLSQGTFRPLESARWSGAVDNVGGATLAALLARTTTAGTVAACGNAGGIELATTVLPFILRGVTLAGIDSNTCPQERREIAWNRLAKIVTTDALTAIDAGTLSLAEIPEAAETITRGAVRGRFVIDPNE